MKKYILIAGVNGAGKSTLFQTLSSVHKVPRVNMDEIVKEIGDWKSEIDLMKAGKIVVRTIKEYFATGTSFNQETTLCGKGIINNIKMAKKLGYFIEMHYVGVDSIEIAKDRVKQRVAKGGHGIPDKDIERRYEETFNNLELVLNQCDLIAFYDNTEKFRRFAIYRNGEAARLSHTLPKWFTDRIR